MKTIYVVLGTNGILSTVGVVGAATTEKMAQAIDLAQRWKLDSSKILHVELAETDNDVLKGWTN